MISYTIKCLQVKEDQISELFASFSLLLRWDLEARISSAFPFSFFLPLQQSNNLLTH